MTLPSIGYFAILATLSCCTLQSCDTQPQQGNAALGDSSSTSGTADSTHAAPQAHGFAFFKATGNEPFWSIALGDDSLMYHTPYDTLYFLNPEKLPSADGPEVTYRASMAQALITVSIVREPCTNTMSGELSPYTVQLTLTTDDSEAASTFSGCGHYLADERLHHSWVLDSIQGMKARADVYATGLPVLELYPSEGRFSGHTGCNQISGVLRPQRNNIYFENTQSTLKACPRGEEAERQFINALARVNTYELEHTRLRLQAQDQVLMVLRKARS